MEVLLEDMQCEQEELESRIENATMEHNMTREELDQIGLHVDQLKDSLANFTICTRMSVAG
jgi:hypothetical protein